MRDKIKKHPALLYTQDIKDICKPLEHLNISYFSHVHVDINGKFSAISNNPLFHEHYLRKQYYNADIHMAQCDNLGKYVIWDHMKCSGQSEKLNQEASEFGVKHSFTLLEKNKDGNNYYHFATHLNDSSINEDYIRNMDLLKIFILHFNQSVSQSKNLHHAYDLTFTIACNQAEFSLHSEILHQKQQRNLFLKNIKFNSLELEKTLSLRELEVLTWLHQGKTLLQIAEILGITEITVKKHVANIKEKTKCYTQFQLGEYFSRFITAD